MHQEAYFPHIWNIKDRIEKDAEEKSSMLKDLVMVQTMSEETRKFLNNKLRQ